MNSDNVNTKFAVLFGSDSAPQYHTPCYDEQLMHSNTLYPICHNLEELSLDVTQTGHFRPTNAEYYRARLLNGSSICGKEHHSLRFLKGKKNRPLRQWTNGCANGIASAKERMSTYLQQLCSDQKLANAHYQHRLQWLARNPRIVAGSVQADVTAEGNIERTASTQIHNQTKEISDAFISSIDTTTYGIIYTGEPKHFQQIHQSITSLVLSNSTQSIHTVEVWVNYYALPRCMRTTLQNVLFLDADNLVTRDVSEVFRNKGYLQTGALLWPDLWGAACEDTSSIRSGHTALKEFVLYAAEFPGLSPGTHTVLAYYQYKQQRGVEIQAENHANSSVINESLHVSHAAHHSNRSSEPVTSNVYDPNIRQYAQEAETGQIVLDLTRHRGLLRLALHMIQDQAFFRRIFNGDKDIFRFVFLITSVPFHFNEQLPGVSVTKSMKKDCIVHYHREQSTSSGSGYDEPPLFFHQLKQRDPKSFNRFLLPPVYARKHASYCVSTNKHITGEYHQGLELHAPKYGSALVQYAEILFNISDTEWAKVR
eukprot:gene9910-11626_t